MKTKRIEDAQFDFLVSAMSNGCFISTEEILVWMKHQKEEVVTNIRQIPIDKLKGWSYRDDKVCHNSGHFYSIEGIHIETNYSVFHQWDQPIINQSEIGFLGFVVQKINGVLHFLVQAKVEPGNLNLVQLSPTLQATRSNYTLVHGGKSPAYLEYFNGEKSVTVLVDLLQSEQGARFLRKRNRNMIVEVDETEEFEVKTNYIWASLGQIKELLRYPNVVNMDSRTVLACINYGSYPERALHLLDQMRRMINAHSTRQDSFLYSVLSAENHLHDLQDIIQWITSMKFRYELSVTPIGISQMRHWTYDGHTISHKDGKYFDVIGVSIEIGNREVICWDQPMVHPAQAGLIAFLVKKIRGIYHFLVQAKMECGNFDVIEMAPTVQCMTGNYRKGQNEYSIPYLEEVLNAPKERIWYSCYQSEEGGRFFQEQNLNTIVEVGDEFPLDVHENYCWMTLNQMLSFVSYNYYLNMAARSLISAIHFY